MKSLGGAYLLLCHIVARWRSTLRIHGGTSHQHEILSPSSITRISFMKVGSCTRLFWSSFTFNVPLRSPLPIEAVHTTRQRPGIVLRTVSCPHSCLWLCVALENTRVSGKTPSGTPTEGRHDTDGRFRYIDAFLQTRQIEKSSRWP